MLKMLCEQLGIHSTAIASLKSLYSNADRTISNHRAWVREQLLFSTYDSNAEARLQAALSPAGTMRRLLRRWPPRLRAGMALRQQDRPARPACGARPGRSAFQVVENLALATIRATVTPVRLRAVLKVMHEESPTPGISLLEEWLKQSAGKHGVKGLKEVNSRQCSQNTGRAPVGLCKGSRLGAFMRSPRPWSIGRPRNRPPHRGYPLDRDRVLSQTPARRA